MQRQLVQGRCDSRARRDGDGEEVIAGDAVAEGEKVVRGVVVLRRLGSGDNLKDAEVGEEHGDWELRERGALVASSRKRRVRERGKEARRMGSAEPHISRGMTRRRVYKHGGQCVGRRTYEDSDAATTTRRKYAWHWCMYADQDPPSAHTGTTQQRG
jgi:hypothetical protein